MINFTQQKQIKPNGFLGVGLRGHSRHFATAPCTARLDEERRRLVVEVNPEAGAGDSMMREQIGGEVQE